ncbi:hypothetical protein AAFF_G00289600 [Aldrovandia affinis]|uniref:Integrase catalytic domain-containing protein n=1 Tax=Aldrovandia affinis TaxID=143900 RepID=A0AAD7W241_9TELE|nr:hypothetical protein AAFF_G00289600 [Aldrovandia affinis]
MVDRTTRWPEAVPLASTTTADVARAFTDTWVSRFGTPSDLSSDRGSQFTSELWAEVARALGVRLHHTTAFHPQANGLCERFHRSMKAALRASLKEATAGRTVFRGYCWDCVLPRRKICSPHRLNWCLARHCGSLETSSRTHDPLGLSLANAQLSLTRPTLSSRFPPRNMGCHGPGSQLTCQRLSIYLIVTTPTGAR